MKQTENVKPSERQTKVLPILPGIIVIAAVSVVVILSGVVVMSRFGIVDLPDFVDDLFSPHHDETRTAESPWSELLDDIGGKRETTEFSPDSPDYSVLSLSTLLPSLTPPDYFQLYHITKRSNTSVAESTVALLHSGVNRRITVYENGEAVYSVVYNGENVKITDRSGSTVIPASQYDLQFEPESDVGLPTEERLTARLAEYENAVDAVTVRFDSTGNIFRVRCALSGGVYEEYDVKADTGIIVSARLYNGEDEAPYYELTTEALYTDVEYNDAVFSAQN